jgi:hypothetical protein
MQLLLKICLLLKDGLLYHVKICFSIPLKTVKPLTDVVIIALICYHFKLSTFIMIMRYGYSGYTVLIFVLLLLHDLCLLSFLTYLKYVLYAAEETRVVSKNLKHLFLKKNHFFQTYQYHLIIDFTFFTKINFFCKKRELFEYTLLHRCDRQMMLWVGCQDSNGNKLAKKVFVWKREAQAQTHSIRYFSLSLSLHQQALCSPALLALLLKNCISLSLSLICSHPYDTCSKNISEGHVKCLNFI